MFWGVSFNPLLKSSGPGEYYDTSEMLEVGSNNWKNLNAKIPVAGAFKIFRLDERIIGLGYNPTYDPDFHESIIALEYDFEQDIWMDLKITKEDHLQGGISVVPASRFECSYVWFKSDKPYLWFRSDKRAASSVLLLNLIVYFCCPILKTQFS